jgi:hypothetical protein
MRCKFIHFYTYLYLLVAVPLEFCCSLLIRKQRRGLDSLIENDEVYKRSINYILKKWRL